jgi:hypothetical protein
MKIKSLFLLFIIVSIQSSCSKKAEVISPEIPVDPTKDYFKNLVDKYYIMVSSTSNPAYPGGFKISTDMYADYYALSCIQDDLKMFKTNGDCIFDNGASRCSSLDSQTVTIKWRFLENNTKIQIYNLVNSNVTDMKILINDGNILKYEMIVKYGSDSYTWTETWKKQ